MPGVGAATGGHPRGRGLRRGRRGPSSASCSAFQAAKRVSGCNSTKHAAAASTPACLPARRPAEPVSSGAPGARSPPGRGFRPQRPPPRAVPRRPAASRASPLPAAAPGRAPGAPRASVAPRLHPSRALPPWRGICGALRGGSPSPRAPRVPRHSHVQWLSGGGEWGASPGGEEPRPGWGVCAVRGRARLTCPPERAPGRVCVCGSVCAHASGGWSDTAVGFSLAPALRLLSPPPAATAFGKQRGSFIFLSLPVHPPLPSLTFPFTQGAAAGHPSTGANT